MTELPDEAIAAFFVGDAHEAWEQDEALVSLASEVLMGATGPAPTPSPALRAFLGEPDAASAVRPEATRPLAAVPAWQPGTVAAGPAPSARGTNVVPMFRRLRLTVGIAAIAGVAAAALAVAGTTGVRPDLSCRPCPGWSRLSPPSSFATRPGRSPAAIVFPGGSRFRPARAAPSAPLSVPARRDRARHRASPLPPCPWPDPACPASPAPTDR